MHRDKTFARILLILSVLNVALAAPAAIRDGHLDFAEDLTAASEKRGNDDVAPDKLPDLSGLSDPSRYSTPPPSLPKRVTWADRWAQPSGLSATLPEPVSDSSPYEPTDTSDHSHYFTTPSPGSTSPQYDSAPESSARPTDDASAPMSRASQPHNDPPPGSGTLELHDDPPIPELHDNLQPGPGTTQFHDHFRSQLWWREIGSGGLRVPGQSAVTAATTAASEADPFITDELKQRGKDFAVYSAVLGSALGVTYGVQKGIMSAVSPGAQTIGRDLASGDVGRRGAGPPLHLPDHFQPRKDGSETRCHVVSPI